MKKNTQSKKPITQSQKKVTLKDHVSVKDLKASKEVKGGWGGQTLCY
jgi:hypothetical protein